MATERAGNITSAGEFVSRHQAREAQILLERQNILLEKLFGTADIFGNVLPYIKSGDPVVNTFNMLREVSGLGDMQKYGEDDRELITLPTPGRQIEKRLPVCYVTAEGLEDVIEPLKLDVVRLQDGNSERVGFFCTRDGRETTLFFARSDTGNYAEDPTLIAPTLEEYIAAGLQNGISWRGIEAARFVIFGRINPHDGGPDGGGGTPMPVPQLNAA